MKRIPLRQWLAAGVVTVFVTMLQMLILWRTQPPLPVRGFVPRDVAAPAVVQPG